MNTKATLPRAALAVRLALDAGAVARRNDQLREHLFRQCLVAQWQHSFLPLDKCNALLKALDGRFLPYPWDYFGIEVNVTSGMKAFRSSPTKSRP